ncbi:MAG: hypothetical protein J1G30_00955 [Spirochaetales bacterium]|nr:hypothetical protein [Spirochaetales bacterium]
MKKIGLIFVLICMLTAVLNAAEIEESTENLRNDELPQDELNKQDLNEQMEREMATFRFDNVNLYKSKVQSAGGDFAANTKYYVQLGSGEYVNLPFLARKMGNERLAKDLTWGHYYNSFKVGFFISLITGVALDVGAVILTVGYATKDYVLGDALYHQDAALGWGITLFAFSTFSITGIITFAVGMAKGARYNYNVIKAKTLVDQYNLSIKRKYDKMMGFDVQGTGSGDMRFCMEMKF